MCSVVVSVKENDNTQSGNAILLIGYISQPLKAKTFAGITTGIQAFPVNLPN